MNKQTYEALKSLVKFYWDNDMLLKKGEMKKIEDWIKEVAKDYCPDCGELNHRCKPEKEVNCIRCNDNGCPACDTARRGNKHNPEPF